MAASNNDIRAGLIRPARFLIVAWALFGGAMLCALILINVYSVVAGAIAGTPFPGDFELTELGVAVAVFAFLPYTQLVDGNVSADIFTSGASPRTVAYLRLLASLIALGFSIFLGWRMWYGLLDKKAYDYTTAILQIPHWYAFVPILISLALLAVASLITTIEAGRDTRTL